MKHLRAMIFRLLLIFSYSQFLESGDDYRREIFSMGNIGLNFRISQFRTALKFTEWPARPPEAALAASTGADSSALLADQRRFSRLIPLRDQRNTVTRTIRRELRRTQRPFFETCE